MFTCTATPLTGLFYKFAEGSHLAHRFILLHEHAELSEDTTFGAIALFNFFEHVSYRFLAIAKTLLRELVVSLLQLCNSHVCLDMNATMGGPIFSPNCHENLFL